MAAGKAGISRALLAIFGHGQRRGLGEAAPARDLLPTLSSAPPIANRAGPTAAIAYAKSDAASPRQDLHHLHRPRRHPTCHGGGARSCDSPAQCCFLPAIVFSSRGPDRGLHRSKDVARRQTVSARLLSFGPVSVVRSIFGFKTPRTAHRCPPSPWRRASTGSVWTVTLASSGRCKPRHSISGAFFQSPCMDRFGHSRLTPS